MSNEPKLSDITSIINSGMDQLLREEKGVPLSKASTKLKGKAFIEFYMKEIAKFIYPFNDDDLIEEGLRCDYKGDQTIDFIYKSDGTYFIYQSKYKGSGNSLSRGEIADFAKTHSRILDTDTFNKYANDDLKYLLREFNSKSVVHYVLLTTDKVSDELRREFERNTKQEVERFKDFEIDFELTALPEIKKDYKSAYSIDEPIPEKITIPIEKIENHFSPGKQYAYIDLTSILGNNTKYMTLLTTIRGTVLKNLYNQYRGRLFNYNIRGYLGLNAINKNMRKTIENNPSMFYLFNNGISAICSNMELKELGEGRGLQLETTNFQIINGAQTTCTIGTSDDSRLRDVRVLLRITKTEDIKKEKGLNKDIITFNNSQTVIKASDFRSNDDIQLFLQNKLSGLIYKQTVPHQKLIYKPKRGHFRKKKDEIYLNMETLAKILYAFNYEPTKIYANSNFLFDIDPSTGKYWELFGENGEECSIYTDERFKIIAGVSMLWLSLNDRLKNEAKITLDKEGETINYQSYLAKWHFLWAYGHIIRTLYPEQMIYIANRILDGKAFQKNNFIDSWFISIAEKLQEQLDTEYVNSKPDQEDEEASIKGFNFKNWLRNAKSFEKLKVKFKRIRKDSFPLPQH